MLLLSLRAEWTGGGARPVAGDSHNHVALAEPVNDHRLRSIAQPGFYHHLAGAAGAVGHLHHPAGAAALVAAAELDYAQRVLTADERLYNGLARSPDGQYLAAAGDTSKNALL